MTPEEHQIAQLARARRINPETGAELFLSARTGRMAPITRRTFQLPRPRPVRHPALRFNGRYSARCEGVNRVAAQRISAHLRSAAGERRATPRRIHGVRLAMTSTARSDRRIAVRGPGVGIDASAASTVPPRTARGRPPAVAKCRALLAARRCRDRQSPCPSRRRGHARRGRRGSRPRRPARVSARRRVRRSRLCPPRAVRTRPYGCRPYPDAQRLGLSAQRLGAADSLRRAVERGEMAVAGALDHRAFEPLRDLAA